MFGFSDFMKSNFGDSTPAPSSLPLEPRLKAGQDAATAPPPPEHFNTPAGERRVPREKDPRKVSYEMIKDARKGILSGFLRLGRLFRASDLVGIVNPKTAIITLNNIYDFETKFLPTIDEQPTFQPLASLSSVGPSKKTASKGAESERSLRNLFYISLNRDELPSYHFWTKPGDVDPVTAGESVNWGEVLDKNPPSPATTARIAMLEKDRKEQVQHGAEAQQSTPFAQLLGSLHTNKDINLPGLGRKPSEDKSANDSEPIPQISASPTLIESPVEAEVLLQFNRGAMYLREFTHKALYAMACWMVENEEEDEDGEEEIGENDAGKEKVRDIYLDILDPAQNVREEKIVSVSRASNRKFQENIKPFLGRSDYKFRIRSDRYQSSWNVASGFDSGGVGDLKYDLKLVRPNVGYCYCSSNWHLISMLSYNSFKFEKALEFLFDWELSAHPSSDRLGLDIPDYGSFDLYRDANLVLGAKIQQIFAKLSDNTGKPDAIPAEIFVRDVVEDDTDGSEFLGASPLRHENVKDRDGPGDASKPYQSLSEASQRIERGSIATGKMPDQPRLGSFGGLITGQSDEHILTKSTEINGGPDMPSIQPRVLTISETNKLQERLRIAEASIVESNKLKEQLKVAEKKLAELDKLKERLRNAEDRARPQSSCPFCSQDWAGMTKQVNMRSMIQRLRC